MLIIQDYVYLDYFFSPKWTEEGRRKRRQDYEMEKQQEKGGRRSPRVTTSCPMRVKDGKGGPVPTGSGLRAAGRRGG